MFDGPFAGFAQQSRRVGVVQQDETIARKNIQILLEGRDAAIVRKEAIG